MDWSVAGVYLPDSRTRWSQPPILCRVQAGFPSPAEDYVEGRIDLNRDLIKHPLSTFYVRVSGDSMVGVGMMPGAILVVDRAVQAYDGHVVVARTDNEMCVKRLSTGDDGRIYLLSENEQYLLIEITEGVVFEV
jgi:DNA polymerase V